MVAGRPDARRHRRTRQDRDLEHVDDVATLAADERVTPSFGNLSVLDLDTGVQRILTAGLDTQCRPFPGARAPIWQGDHLLFSLEDRGDVHVYRIPADGSGPAELLLGGTRAVTGYDLAGDTLAFVATSPTSQSELFVTVDGVSRQLTTLCEAFHRAVHIALPDHFTVPSPAGDGSEDDLRCHVEQADALFVALQMLGKPVEYWRFPEESHDLSCGGSPRHRVQRAEIILD